MYHISCWIGRASSYSDQLCDVNERGEVIDKSRNKSALGERDPVLPLAATLLGLDATGDRLDEAALAKRGMAKHRVMDVSLEQIGN